MVAGSTSLPMANRGTIFDVTGPSLSFHAGTFNLSFRAGLETTKRLLRGSLPARTALSRAAPPYECPSGTTSAPAIPSTCLTNADTSSVHCDQESVSYTHLTLPTIYSV